MLSKISDVNMNYYQYYKLIGTTMDDNIYDESDRKNENLGHQWMLANQTNKIVQHTSCSVEILQCKDKFLNS